MRFAEDGDNGNHYSVMVNKVKMPDKIIMDTGTGVHLIGLKNIKSKDRDKMTFADDNLRLCTANGKIDANFRIGLNSDILQESLEAVVLDKTPTAVSVGRLCMDGDWELIWRNKKNPVLRKPGVKSINLPVNNYVPYIKTHNSFNALTADGNDNSSSDTSSSASEQSDEAERARKEKLAAELFGDAESGEEDDLSVKAVKGSSSSSKASSSKEDKIVKDKDEEDEDMTCGECITDLKREALSVKHLMIHLPKNPHCVSCQRAKKQFKQARRKNKRMMIK